MLTPHIERGQFPGNLRRRPWIVKAHLAPAVLYCGVMHAEMPGYSRIAVARLEQWLQNFLSQTCATVQITLHKFAFLPVSFLVVPALSTSPIVFNSETLGRPYVIRQPK